MTIVEYFSVVKSRLLTDSMIASFHIVRERYTLVDGHMRARLTLVDGHLLEFSEYIQRDPGGKIEVVTYSYHWADAQGNLLKRWDNTPHFPGLPNFPHHIHDGIHNTVLPGTAMDIFVVLDQIRS